MTDPVAHDRRLANMRIAAVYPLYVRKIERKGRTVAELNQVIQRLTGFHTMALQTQIGRNATFEQFFQDAALHPHADPITGVICGYCVEDIANPLSQKVRFLDKLVDELA